MINRYIGELSTDARLVVPKFGIAGLSWSAEEAVAADTDGIIDGGACGTSAVTIYPDEGAAMPCARNVTATAGGTAGDIKAVKATVYGTDIDDLALEEELPAFTADTAGAVTGSKAFKTVTKVVVPAMDGAGATIDLGWGDKLGLPFKLDGNVVLFANKEGSRETTAPTVAFSATELASNTVDLNSALDGDPVEVYLTV